MITIASDDMNIFEGGSKMGMLEWAENEIRIACERENPDREEGEFDYGCACYESALKAFKSLIEDEHSGMSISITRNILNRLILGKPLTPIEDTDDIWNECSGMMNDRYKTYQCKRMSSLFKDVYKDGTVKYSDVDRVLCIDINSQDISYHSGFITRLVDEMFQITMPYCPDTKPYKVYIEDFLYDSKNGDFDTIGIFYLIKPTEERIEINRFFKEGPNGCEEISRDEYITRRSYIE